MAFPNTYSVGITSLGFQIIWATLAQRIDIDVRRQFTDQEDAPHRRNDLFGFSLSWELDGPVLLDLLEKNKIPIWSQKRSENDPIVFGGGQVLTANPEPFAPFLDVVLLGDGENLLPAFINTIQEKKDLSRTEKLKALAQVPGIYVPIFYQPQYNCSGELIGITPTSPDIPSKISKQTWKKNILSHSTVITPEAAWPNIHMIEVVRSCPELCRFCLASYLNLPFRNSSLEAGLIPAVEKGFAITKRIGLLGASISQHPEFEDLLNWLNKDRFEDMRLSLSSVRATTVNLKMTQLLSRRNSKSITIAIESGSEKLRQVINKKLAEEEIFAAARYAKEGGLKSMKLYGMVGLPTENEDDIQASVDLLLKIKQRNSGLRLTFGVSTFVPKAHTPFQWFGLRKESKKRLKKLAKQLKPNGIDFRPESYGWSVIQTLISRSDRRLANVIALVRGSNNSLGGWKKAYKTIQDTSLPNISNQQLPHWEQVINNEWSIDQALPWMHIEGPLTFEQLIKHQEHALIP
ncbi:MULTISPECIES: B12-binding domain-containing radical SAM protein [Prochlorococcus]|uniref:SAM radical enzyme n=1 Tax=Prochlorococcus marinus (strain SARG / CCMP1375 / SS120) TaxID=167539 RepID=Q7V9G5_PROMA|nr:MULTISPECIES: radical SAM protein [Prochlorococcus]AAQ00912.1 SAM radical enzyme [Prochlorococcus marinus subsp. marinus str. CCMP1375]KGG10593.1 hypothetical protein EV04_1552 [Prochlorococcus marinus str. LG]KGG19941.1 hypothetical protein EV08_1255 [Prochlorococcus marinus str. SS2]KGG23839.1 hypothetical protein EV09_0441 [Prochlorococcus marinus str. SS35]KGG31901.1 hypothetical protein EV10_2000 [Prochlorococcus marinus str. SS51]